MRACHLSRLLCMRTNGHWLATTFINVVISVQGQGIRRELVWLVVVQKEALHKPVQGEAEQLSGGERLSRQSSMQAVAR